jgi:hypothetical protein
LTKIVTCRSGAYNWGFDGSNNACSLTSYSEDGIAQLSRTFLDIIEIIPAAKPDADGWIEWRGGECPVPVGTMFRYASQR